MRPSCCGASPWLVHDVPEHSHSVVVAHVLEVYVVHLQNNIEKMKTRRPAQNLLRNAARFHLPSAVLTHLQQHVPGLDAAVCCHGSALHDGADVDSSVAPLVALADDADAQKVVLLCRRSGVHKVTRHNSQRNSDMKYDPDLQNKTSSFTTWGRIVLNDQPSNSSCILRAHVGYLPMLRVTVMMFRDIVESVMLLNEDDWRSEQKKREKMRL